MKANAGRILAAVVLLLAGPGVWIGCDSDSQSLGRTEVVCPFPKPPGPVPCTKEYDPVCGQMSDDLAVTFGNGCEACADPRVISYTSGPCE
jgi:hypothetical protein